MDEPLALPFHGLDNIDRNFAMALRVDGVPGTNQRANTDSGALQGTSTTTEYGYLPLRYIVRCIWFRELLQPRITEYMLYLVPCRSEQLEIAPN